MAPLHVHKLPTAMVRPTGTRATTPRCPTWWLTARNRTFGLAVYATIPTVRAGRKMQASREASTARKSSMTFSQAPNTTVLARRRTSALLSTNTFLRSTLSTPNSSCPRRRISRLRLSRSIARLSGLEVQAISSQAQGLPASTRPPPSS